MRGITNRSTTRRVRTALSAAVVVCAVTAVLPGAASAEPTAMAGLAGNHAAGVEGVSVAADGTQGDDNSADASITPDGRRIVFSSLAKNLTPDQPTGGDMVFVRDQQTRQTKRMGNLSTRQPPVISGNGEYVAYPVKLQRDVRVRQYKVATATDIPADCSGLSCNQPSLNTDGNYIALVGLFRRPSSSQSIELLDRNTNTRVTVATFDHVQPSKPSLSGDGRYVAYQDGEAGDVFVWDRTSGTGSGPVEDSSKGAATLVQLSDDGTKVVYLSGSDTYVHDMSSDTDQLVPNVRGVAIDPTGRYLLYAPNDATGPSLTLRDLQTDTDKTVSEQPASAGTHAVSANGKDVVFHSAAPDIVPGNTNGKSQVFVRHFD